MKLLPLRQMYLQGRFEPNPLMHYLFEGLLMSSRLPK